MGPLPHEAWIVLGSWAFWFPVFAGVGALFWKQSGLDGWTLRFWAGWSASLLFLQWWHFVLPIDRRAVVALAAIGAAGLLRRAPEFGATMRLLARRGFLVAAGLVVAVWLAQLALGGVRNGDSGLYHVPVMHWMAEYPVVPGLGNLHVRFASNQSALLYAALCDAGPVPGLGTHTMNGLLVLVLLAQTIGASWRVLSGASRLPCSDAFLALFAVPAAALALTLNLTSPSPDVPVFACGAALMAMLLRFVEDGCGRNPDGELLAIATVAVAGVTVKLSLAFLSGAGLAVAMLYWLRRVRPDWRRASRATLAIAAIVVVGFGAWVARNAVLSGTLVYPVPSTWLPFDWSVPVAVIDAERRFIGSWNGTLSLGALRDWAWLKTMLRSFGWERWDVVGPFALAAAAAAAVPLRLALRRPSRVPHALLLVPTLVALASWFVVAPMPRFAGAALWALAFQLLLWSVDGVAPRVLPRALVGAALVALPWLPSLQGAPAWSGLRGFEPVSPPRMEPRVLPGGLEVLVPRNDVCLDGPLLCTPTPTPGLALREPGNLGAGFRFDPELATQAGAASPPAGP